MNNVNEKENNIPEKKNNKANIKKAWQTPEIIDLDVADKTSGKDASYSETGGTAYGPS